MLDYGWFSPSVPPTGQSSPARLICESGLLHRQCAASGSVLFLIPPAVLPSPQLQHIPCPAQCLACLLRKCLVEERRQRRRERAQAVLQVVLRKERSYGLESGWRHLLRGSGTSGLVMWYKVSSPTVAARSWTQDFPLRIFETTECLGDVADLLLWERFHSSGKKKLIVLKMLLKLCLYNMYWTRKKRMIVVSQATGTQTF